MARRSTKTAGIDPFADLAKKIEILEQEMAVQRAALEKLREMGTDPMTFRDTVLAPARKSA